MNILAEVKSFSLRIDDSICSLNKTQTRILILITSVKRYKNVLEHKTTFPDELFPSILEFPLIKAIQVRKFMSKFVRLSVAYRGLVARHSMRREKTGDKCCRFVQFAKQILAISLAVRGFHTGRFTRIFGSHSSVTNSPVKGSSIIALTNLPSKLSTTEKQWAIYHASSRR